jgi:hypothetical protein
VAQLHDRYMMMMHITEESWRANLQPHSRLLAFGPYSQHMRKLLSWNINSCSYVHTGLLDISSCSRFVV